MKLLYYGCPAPGSTRSHGLWAAGMKDASVHRATVQAVPWWQYLDGGFAPRGVEEEPGLATLTWTLDRFTVLAFWDRSGEDRYGCNSAFVARGQQTFDAMVAAAREQFPEVWQRLPFTVRQHGDQPVMVGIDLEERYKR